MTIITVGSGATQPIDAATLESLAIWAAVRAFKFQPDLQFDITKQRPDGSEYSDLSHWCSFEPMPSNDNHARVLIAYYLPLVTDYAAVSGQMWEKIDLDIIDGNSPAGATNDLAVGSGSTIPSNVTKLTELLCWIGELAAVIYSSKLALLPTRSNNWLSAAIASNTTSPLYGDIRWYRLIIPINREYAANSTELYQEASEIASVVIPNSYQAS